MKKLFFSILILSTFLFTQCMPIVQSIFGIKDSQRLSDNQITNISKSYKIDQGANYRLDTSYFSDIIKLDTFIFKKPRKNHLQPLQALYFDSKGKLVKFYINCYAGGFPNLQWNRNGNLESFLPKDQAPIDTVLNLKKMLGYLHPVCLTSSKFLPENQDYFVFVFWNKSTKRHSKRLIRSIKKNVALASNLQVKLIFVNYDNIFYTIEHYK